LLVGSVRVVLRAVASASPGYKAQAFIELTSRTEAGAGGEVGATAWGAEVAWLPAGEVAAGLLLATAVQAEVIKSKAPRIRRPGMIA
jgi:hypothetical protein